MDFLYFFVGIPYKVQGCDLWTLKGENLWMGESRFVGRGGAAGGRVIQSFHYMSWEHPLSAQVHKKFTNKFENPEIDVEFY